ncbi:MAG: Smr/MutS family protein [Rhizobiaceae bacterium]
MQDKRKKHLSQEDQALWEAVRKTVKPLRNTAAPPASLIDPKTESPSSTSEMRIEAPARSAKDSTKLTARALPSWQAPPQSRRPEPYPQAQLDDTMMRKLRKGALQVDDRIDLHGMFEYQAHQMLLSFLESSRHSGCRIVLVITGKGERTGSILRNAVPRWLVEPVFRPLVSGYRVAAQIHGGEGALYIRLRRQKENR